MIDICGKIYYGDDHKLRVFKNYLPKKTKDAYFIDNAPHYSRIVICMAVDC